MAHQDPADRDDPASPPAAPAPAPADAPDFVVIDVETACSRASSICQVGIVGFRDGAITFEYETLLDPRDEFNVFNTRIHGIRADHVRGRPCFADVHAVLDGHLSGRVTVAHSSFDKGALAAACRVHERPAIETRWLDSVRVAQRAWPDLGSHRLNALARFLGIAHRHHDALSDARAAGYVVVRAIEHTGLSLADWLTPPVRVRPGAPPPPADAGPLHGERVAILGEPRDGPLAHAVAALGGRIVAAVGRTTTILAVAGTRPFDATVTGSGDYRRARRLAHEGAAIRILTAAEACGG